MRKIIFCLILITLFVVNTVNADTKIIYFESTGSPYQNSVGESFATVNSGTGTSVTHGTISVYVQESTYGLITTQERGMMIANLTNQTGITISSVVLSGWGNNKDNTFASTIDVVITNCSPSTHVVQGSDYNKGGNWNLGTMLYSNFATSQWNNVTLNTLYFQQNLGGYAPLMWQSSASFNNAAPTYSGDNDFYDEDIQENSGAHPPFLTITYTIGGSAPVASFTIDKTKVFAGLPVTFTDTSTNSPTFWNYSWGDSTANGTTQNPTHTYTTAGTYSVLMNAGNSYGSNQSTTQTITVYTLEPVPNFTRYGTVLPGTVPWEDNNTYEATVIYDTNPQILGGTHVYKMWYVGGWASPGVGYAESSNGINWTKYGSNPVLNNYYRSSIVKDGSIYYILAALNGDTQIDLYNSTDGLSWTLNVSNVIPLGGVGAWDHTDVANTAAWKNTSGVWNVVYEGSNDNGGSWYLGLATGTSLWSLTKYGTTITTIIGDRRGGPDLYIINGSVTSMVMHGAVSGGLPTDLYKYDSFDEATWTASPSGSFFNRTGTDEGEGSSVSQVGDPFVLDRGTTKYLYYSTTPDGTSESGHSHIKLATTNGLANDVVVPVASFTKNYNTLRIPNRITVTDTSTNTPTSWNWSWGDSTWTNITSSPNQTHQYLKRGVWNIYLLASNSAGNNQSATQAVRVVGYQDVQE